MPFAEIRDHRLYYEDSGGSGPAVLFNHGFLLDHGMFDAQVEALGRDFRCLTVDARGHGMSECHGPFDYWDAAGDCVALLDQLGIGRAVFVGMSQGGFTALRAAVAYAERVSALVLIDTAAASFDAETLEGYRATQKAWVEQGPIGEVATGMADLIFGPGYDASTWIAKWQSRAPSAWNEVWNTVLGRDDLFHRLKEIGCPSFVIHGADDTAFDHSVAEGMRDELPDCRGLLVVPGAAHAPNLTHPEPVNRVLREFLDENAT
jgi:pimeloyl-ACP methyl ester carboxylesterase